MSIHQSVMSHLLPVGAYISQDWFHHEMDEIFSKTWHFAGFVEDLKNPGDYLTVQAGLNNIFIAVGPDGKTRAFHNICRHRGTQLLRSAGRGGKAITCPYHDWSYNYEGELVAVPDQKTEFPDLDFKCYGLKPASVAIWRGMYFVHPDENAISLKTWFDPINAHLGPHVVEELIEYEDSRREFEIKANWKIVVENYIDPYHLAHLHSGSLPMYDHKGAEFGFHGPHFSFYEPLAEDYAQDIDNKAAYPLVIEKKLLGVWTPMLFPGLGLEESESSWSIFHIQPVSPNKTKVVLRSKLKKASAWEFGKQAMRSASFWEGKIRGKYANSKQADDPLLSGDFMAEDIYVCEQQQKSMYSPYFEAGPLAQQKEIPILEHQKLIKQYLRIE